MLLTPSKSAVLTQILLEIKAPAEAPNDLVVLVDDLGFAGTSAFGGPVNTPTFDRLADEGLHWLQSMFG